MQDLDSVNGTFIRIREPHELEPADRFILGGQLFEFEADPATLIRIGGDGERAEEWVFGARIVIGREVGDIVFGDDPLMSGSHASISAGADGNAVLEDDSSSNGVYVMLRRPHELEDGDFISAGKQVMKFHQRAADPFKRVD